MILEVNVPKTIRNWAVCQVNLHHAEQRMEMLAGGQTGDPNHHWLIKARGRAWFIEHIVEPKIRRLKRACRRYRALAEAIEVRFDPQGYLADRNELVDMIGSTLHYTRRGREVFETLQYCSEDGQKLFSNLHQEARDDGIDAVTLLSLGFGRSI
ncbi:MAG: hypothetical protein IJS14_10930 [Lentisphaeria bacterium]|nr:hypothetical protein [Lentisphaeria bacterium]